MEILKLNFDTEILGKEYTFTVEVPYHDGEVATSEFCPTELITGTTELLAAIRGESLERFIADTRCQLLALSMINDAETEFDRHIGALMAVVMERMSRDDKILFGDLLLYVDCFSLLLKSTGCNEEQIKIIYPHIVRSIANIYPDQIFLTADGIPLAGSHTEVTLQSLTERKQYAD